MKILLTGADGFTGVHFTRAAQAAQHEVVPLRADLTNEAALQAEVAAVQPEWVVHLAGIAFVGHADDAALYAVNTVGTATLLGALAALPVRPSKVLVASSANVYGNCKHSPIAEDAPLAPANHYAASKMAMEAMARTYADRLPLVIARPFNYTGVGQSLSFLIPKLVSHFASRSSLVELGNLAVMREFNHVALVCSAYLTLLAAEDDGHTYNICSGKMYSLREVLALLNELTGHHLRVQVNPALVRQNEVLQLCGAPGKLQALQRYSAVQPQVPSLADTLSEMLDAMDATTGTWAHS